MEEVFTEELKQVGEKMEEVFTEEVKQVRRFCTAESAESRVGGVEFVSSSLVCVLVCLHNLLVCPSADYIGLRRISVRLPVLGFVRSFFFLFVLVARSRLRSYNEESRRRENGEVFTEELKQVGLVRRRTRRSRRRENFGF